KMKEDVTGIPGFSIIQTFQISDYIYNEIVSQIGFEYKTTVNQSEILNTIRGSYNSIIEPKREEIETVIENLEKLYNTNQIKYANLVNVIDTLKNKMTVFTDVKKYWTQTEDLTSKNIDSFEKIALNKVKKYTGLTQKEIFD